MSVRDGRGNGRGNGRPAEIRLSTEERFDFLREIARIYRTEAAANTVLDQIAIPLGNRPAWQNINAEQWWTQIFYEFDAGIVTTPYRALLYAAIRTYAGNQTLRAIAIRHGVIRPEAEDEVDIPGPGERTRPGRVTGPTGPGRVTGPDWLDGPGAFDGPGQATGPGGPGGPREGEYPAAPTEPFCHVIVRAASAAGRDAAAAQLAALGLTVTRGWATPYTVSFAVDTADHDRVQRLLDETDLQWVVVPAGQPDYLFHRLSVEGPDGRRWGITDAPAHQTVADLGGGVMEEHYPDAVEDANRQIVIDQVGPDGTGRRLRGDDTLHDAGVRENDTLHVGVDSRAGAINPYSREDALYRVRNQIVAYARAHPGFEARANAELAPTEYELSFVTPSLGPPARPGGEPPDTTRHRLFLQLGPQFPETAPRVFWESPVFHPNVYPNYREYPPGREDPLRGLVCLGALAESYQPSLDFQDLCQMLVDMAAYRNYGLYDDTNVHHGRRDSRIRANFYDRAAYDWARTPAGQDRIAAIGGRRFVERPRRTGYRNVITHALADEDLTDAHSDENRADENRADANPAANEDGQASRMGPPR